MTNGVKMLVFQAIRPGSTNPNKVDLLIRLLFDFITLVRQQQWKVPENHTMS